MKTILKKLNTAGAKYGMTSVDTYLSPSEVEQLIERLSHLRHKVGKFVGVPLRDNESLLPYRTVDCYSYNGLWWTVQEPNDLPLILL